MLVNPNMPPSEDGQAAVRELCDTLEATFGTLTVMADRTTSDDLRPALLPFEKGFLQFTWAVLKNRFTSSRFTDLVKGLRGMRSDVQTCLIELEATFQHVHDLYDIMNIGLPRISSRASVFSTSTTLTVRIQLAGWLKRFKGAWGLSRQRGSTSVSHPVSSQTPSHFILGFSFVTS